MKSPDVNMNSKVALITGGTGGIGRATALSLAKRGASVAIVGRNRERGEQVIETINDQPSGSAELYLTDLSSQESIRELAEQFTERHDRLDVLVNNAGMVHAERTETTDGIEAVLAVNHLAPFLLSYLLVDLLVASAPARIVTVSSGEHERGSMNFADLQATADYDMRTVYRRSKLANLLFTYELADRLDGTDVTANAVDPGFVPGSGLGSELRGISGRCLRFLIGFRSRSHGIAKPGHKPLSTLPPHRTSAT